MLYGSHRPVVERLGGLAHRARAEDAPAFPCAPLLPHSLPPPNNTANTEGRTWWEARHHVRQVCATRVCCKAFRSHFSAAEDAAEFGAAFPGRGHEITEKVYMIHLVSGLLEPGVDANPWLPAAGLAEAFNLAREPSAINAAQLWSTTQPVRQIEFGALDRMLAQEPHGSSFACPGGSERVTETAWNEWDENSEFVHWTGGYATKKKKVGADDWRTSSDVVSRFADEQLTTFPEGPRDQQVISVMEPSSLVIFGNKQRN